MTERLRVSVNGVVQGVGFRPFVYRLATGLEQRGWVSNTTEGVIIEAEGEPNPLGGYIWKTSTLPLALINFRVW